MRIWAYRNNPTTFLYKVFFGGSNFFSVWYWNCVNFAHILFFFCNPLFPFCNYVGGLFWVSLGGIRLNRLTFNYFIFVKDMYLGILVGTMIVFSRVTWPILWLGLELNLICFLPLAFSRNKNSILYFIIQRIGRLLILRRGIFSDFILLVIILLRLALVLKLGLIPLHFWVIKIAPDFSKGWLFLFLTWQKLGPLSVLTFLMISKLVLILGNVYLARISIIACTSPILIILFSGFNQIGWVLAIITRLIWYYVSIYFIILTPIIIYINRTSPNFSISLFNLAGVPPFRGFAIKIKAILQIKRILSLLIVMGSAIALVSYTRILINANYELAYCRRLLFFPLLIGLV